jgi:hypothetical protein
VKIVEDEPRFVVGHLLGEDSVCPAAFVQQELL